MLETHTLNKSLRRLEPKETKCSYCKTGEVSDRNQCVYYDLYLVKKSLNAIVFEYHKYNQIAVGVPRCTKCKSIHQKISTKANLYAWLIGSLFLIIPFLAFGLYGILGLIPFLLIGIFGANTIQNGFAELEKIDLPSVPFFTDPLVITMCNQGWSPIHPSI